MLFCLILKIVRALPVLVFRRGSSEERRHGADSYNGCLGYYNLWAYRLLPTFQRKVVPQFGSVCVFVTIDGAWIGYTRDSELQAPPLITTIHKSPQHLLSPFLFCCVFTSRSLATASNGEDSSASVLTSLLSGEYPTTELSTER
jgi:hypothetical protein